MEKMKIQNKLGTGALILLLSGVVCKVLGATFRLPLTNLLGIEGIGIFQIIMSLYAFALVVSCGGVTVSLSKLIGTARAKGDHQKIKIYLRRAVGVSVLVGLLIGVLFLFLGNYISVLQGIVSNKSYYLFVILLPLGAGLAALRGFFQGYENMLPTATSQIVEQVFKFAFGLLFAFYFGRLGMPEGVFGAFLGITLSEVVSLCYLFFLFFFKNKVNEKIKIMSESKYTRREFDKANIPLTISASILPLVNAFDAFIIIPRLLKAGFTNGLATKLFGLQAGVVGAILNFPLIISIAVATALLPNISYLISKGSGGKVMIEKGLKILLFMILPTTFGIIAIAKPLFVLVYTDMTSALLETAFQLMLYGGFSIIFTALMQYFIMLLQANGHFRFIVAITVLGGIAKANLSFFLSAVPSVNIFALIMGNIALSAIVCVLALWKLKRTLVFSISAADILLLIFATAIMFVCVFTFVNCGYFNLVVNMFLAVILGLIVYFVLTLPFLIKMKESKKKFA